MAHHRRAPESTRVGGEEPEYTIHSAGPSRPAETQPSARAEKPSEANPPEKKKTIFDYEIAGFPWPLIVVMLVIVLGVLGLALSAMGVF